MNRKKLRSLTRRAAALLFAALSLLSDGLLTAPARAAEGGEVAPQSTTTKFVMWDWNTNMQAMGTTVDANSSDTANHYQRIMFYHDGDGSRWYFNTAPRSGSDGGYYSTFKEDHINLWSNARIENSANREWNQDLIDGDHFITKSGVNAAYIAYGEYKNNQYHAWRIFGANTDDSRSEYALMQVDDYENLDYRRTSSGGTASAYGSENKGIRVDPWIIEGSGGVSQRFWHYDNDAGTNEDLYFENNGKFLKSSNTSRDYFKTYLGREIAVPTLAVDFAVKADQISTVGRPVFYIPKGRKLTVESEGVLSINGLLLNDGEIVVEDGGLLILKEGARVMPFTKYGTSGRQGAVTSYGTIVVQTNSVLCGGGETGLLIGGGNLTNFGLVCSECMKLDARGVADNRENAYIIGGRSPSRAMRIQMFQDAWAGRATDVESIVNSLTKVGDYDSKTTMKQGAVYGVTDGDHVKTYGGTAITVGSADNPLIKVYTKDKPTDTDALLFSANMDDIDMRADGDAVVYTVKGKEYRIENKLVSANIGRGGEGEEKMFANLWAGSVEGGWIAWEPACAPGLWLDAETGKGNVGDNVYIYQSHGGSNQLWKVEASGKTAAGVTAYRLNTGAYKGTPGRGLDLPNKEAPSGANVSLGANDDGADQLWTLVPTGDKGYYYIRNGLNSGVSLDVENAGKADRTNVRVWINNTGDAQKWRAANLLTVEVYNAAADAAAALEFAPLNAPKTRLDLTGGSANDGTNVQIYEANQTTSQRWTLQMAGIDTLSGVVTPFYRIANVETGTVLEPAGGTLKNGANVAAYSVKAVWEANTQYWYLQDAGGGAYYISCRGNTDYVLDVANGGTGNGTNVWIALKNQSDAQKWTVSGVDNVKAAVEDAIKKTASDTLGGRLFSIKVWGMEEAENCVDSFGGGSRLGFDVMKGSGSQTWQLIRLGTDTVNGTSRPYYQFVMDGNRNYAIDIFQDYRGIYHCKTGENNTGQKSQQWYVERNEDGSYTITSRENGRVWARKEDVEHPNSFDVDVVRSGSSGMEKWELVDLSEDPFHGQVLGIAPLHAQGMTVALAENSYTAGTKIAIRTAEPSIFMQWMFVRMGADIVTGADGEETEKAYYRISSDANSYSMKSSATTPKDGGEVISGSYDGGKEKLWYVEDTDDGYYIIANRADANFVLNVKDAGTADGTSVQLATRTGKDNQKFILTGLKRYVNGKAVDPFDGKVFNLSPGHAMDKRLQIAASGGYTYIQLYDERAYEGQKFMFKLVGTETKEGGEYNYYTIFSTVDMKVALGIGSSSNGAYPYFMSYDASSRNQQWYIESAGGGFYYIVPRADQTRVLEVPGNDDIKSNGTWVQLWENQKTATDQKWRLTETLETKELGTYQMQPKHAPNTDITLEHYNSTNSTKVVIWNTRDSSYHRWKFIQMGADSVNGQQKIYYRIENKGSGKVFDPGGINNITADSQIGQFDYDYGLDQMWYIEDAGDGYYYIINRCDRNYCLTAKDSGKTDGTAVTISKKANGDNQKWNLISKMDPVDFGTFEMAPASAPDMRADIAADDNGNGADVRIHWRNGRAYEQFKLTQVGADMIDGEEKPYYTVQNMGSKKYFDVSTTDGKINNYNIQQYDYDGYADQHYYLEDQRDGSFVLRNRSDTTLVVEASGTEDTNTIRLGKENEKSSSQKWILHKITDAEEEAWKYSRTFATEAEYGRYILTPQHKTSFVLGVKDQSGSDGGEIVQCDSDSSDYQIWKFIQVGEDYLNGELLPYYRITNSGSNKVAETSGYRIPSVSTTVRQWSYDYGYDQTWYMEETETEGVYLLTARGNPDLCLGIRNKATAANTQVMVLKKTGDVNQQWKLGASE